MLMKFAVLLLIIACGLIAYVIVELLAQKGRENDMRVRDFIREVTLKEGKKDSLSIAQVSEVVKIIDDMLDGELYPLIRQKKA